MDHEKQTRKFFHIRWILVGLLCGFYDIYHLRVRNIFPRNMYTGLWVFRLSPTTMSALTCNIWQNTYEPIFPKTRAYPCSYWICHMDPIKYIRTYDFKLFQVEVTSVTSVYRSTECDGNNSSTSFFKIGLYEIKRQESTRLQIFLLCVVQK